MTIRLDLSTPQAKQEAAKALPALMMGSAMGSTAASDMAGQILGQIMVDALQPSIDAMNRLIAQNHLAAQSRSR